MIRVEERGACCGGRAGKERRMRRIVDTADNRIYLYNINIIFMYTQNSTLVPPTLPSYYRSDQL